MYSTGSSKKAKLARSEYNSLDMDKERCCRCTLAQWQMIWNATQTVLLFILVILVVACWATFRGDMQDVRTEYYVMKEEVHSLRKTSQMEKIPQRLMTLLSDMEKMSQTSDNMVSLVDMAKQAMEYIKNNRMLERTLELEQEVQHLVNSFLHPFVPPPPPP
jgi:hypothetical protein